MICCHGEYLQAAIEAARSARARLIAHGATEQMLARVAARVKRRLWQENPEIFDDHLS